MEGTNVKMKKNNKKVCKLDNNCVRLKNWLKEINMSQLELAKIINYSPQYLSNVINGKRPLTYELAKLISDATTQKVPNSRPIRIRPEYLLNFDNIKTSEDAIMYYQDYDFDSAIRKALRIALDKAYKKNKIDAPESCIFKPYKSIYDYNFLQLLVKDAVETLADKYVTDELTILKLHNSSQKK